MDLENGSAIRGEENPYVCPADKVIKFRLVCSRADLEQETTEENSFIPEFCHQHFGENETIFGYLEPKVELLYSAADLKLFIRFSHKGTVTDKHSDMTPDDIMALLKEHIPFPFETNVDNFAQSLDELNKKFRPQGEIVHSFSIQKENVERGFFVRKVEASQVDQTFVDIYKRMESFALWFIDAASYTDTDDEKWHYYTLYEKYRVNGETDERHAFAGYAAIYDYYAFPEHVRPRIGHILILPPFRRCGAGVQLLQAVYRDLVHDSKVVDITAEDPSDNFIHLRDFVDCVNCSELESFKPDSLKAGWSKQMEIEAKERLKICKKQARRVYEILRLKHMNCKDEKELKSYRLAVKKRLNAPFQKNKQDYKKLSKVLQPDELVTALAGMDPEIRIPQLQKMYEDTVDDYRYTLNRLATHAGNELTPII